MSNVVEQNQVREAAIRQWRSTPALQAEFSSAETYAAFRAAMARGSARIAPATALHFKNHAAHTASDLRTDTAAASGQLSLNVQPGRAVARDDREAVKSIVREFQQTRRPGSYRLDEISGFVAARAGLSEAQALYVIEQSCNWSQAVD